MKVLVSLGNYFIQNLCVLLFIWDSIFFLVLYMALARINNNNTGSKPLFLHRKETSACGGVGLRPFIKITPTRWCVNGCPHVRPHPDLTNLEEFLLFVLGHFWLI